jgi:probable rRNA maturation factor
MKIIAEINNKSKSKVSRAFVLKIINNTLKEAKIKSLNDKDISLSIAFISETEIEKINKAYRKVNSATDILSFSEYGNAKKLAEEKEKKIFLGELVLCYNDICDWAGKNRLNCKAELARALAHGTLHLLGFKHGKKMFDIQNYISENIIINTKRL